MNEVKYMPCKVVGNEMILENPRVWDQVPEKWTWQKIRRGLYASDSGAVICRGRLILPQDVWRIARGAGCWHSKGGWRIADAQAYADEWATRWPSPYAPKDMAEAIEQSEIVYARAVTGNIQHST